MKNYLLGCDWGTSSFRLRLINISDHQLLGELISQEGIVNTFNAWKKSSKKSGITRNQYFCHYLKKQIDALSAKLAMSLDHVTVVVSGMASSSIGMEEIPYAHLPFAVDGRQASIRCFDMQEGFPHKVILISGVQSQQDVMRGEETQLIGLMALLDRAGHQYKDAILIFPGTHSKHVYIQNSQVVNFQTFMTGEIFNLMAKYSILKDSIEISAFTAYKASDLDAFKLGLKEAGASNILHGLFTTRTNQLFGKLSKKQNYLYLSGLLIGTELRHLLEKENYPLVLCSGSNLNKFYILAIEELQLSSRTTSIAADLIDKAAITGQIKVFQNQASKFNKTPI